MGKLGRLVVVTGMSGSGRSTCLRALEDVGYFCVDNVPASLLPQLNETLQERMAQTPVAVGIDVRAGELLQGLGAALQQVRAAGVTTDVVFLDCQDDVLIRRFSETRRKHPIWQAGSLSESIARERAAVHELRELTTLSLDSSELNVHQLKRTVQRAFGQEALAELRLLVAIRSFGYKHGLPRDADWVFDVRYLDNPYFVPELADLTGMDPTVAQFVMDHGGQDALQKMAALVDHALPLHAQEGRAMVTIGLGCTGGQHRSVALAEALAEHVRGLQLGRVFVEHRDRKTG
jgi:UPF0042 nucleotide-binding protein